MKSAEELEHWLKTRKPACEYAAKGLRNRAQKSAENFLTEKILHENFYNDFGDVFSRDGNDDEDLSQPQTKRRDTSAVKSNAEARTSQKK